MTGLNKISGQYSVSSLNKKKASGGVYNGFGFGAASSESSDEASFSSFAVELAKINAEFKNVPDVREDVVAKFKEQIDNGTYNPPLDKVAHALIVAGMLDNI